MHFGIPSQWCCANSVCEQFKDGCVRVMWSFHCGSEMLECKRVADPSGVVCLSSPFISVLHISASVLCPQLNPSDKLLICHKSANTQTKINMFYTLPFVLNSLFPVLCWQRAELQIPLFTHQVIVEKLKGMQFGVDRLQNKLDCKSCVVKNNEKDKCQEDGKKCTLTEKTTNCQMGSKIADGWRCG